MNFVTWRKYFHRWERCFLFRLAEGLWLFNFATNALLRGINWLNKSAINVSSCYRLVSFHTDDLKLVTSIYEVMYPKRQIEESHLAETIYKFGSFKTGQTRVGPKRSQEEYVLPRYWHIGQETTWIFHSIVPIFQISHSFFRTLKSKINEHYDEEPLAKGYIHCMTWHHSIQFIS